MSITDDYPEIILNDETMREGLQIESADIPIDDKIELLNALSRTGLKNIVACSFVSPKWVPQMAHVDELLERFDPEPGVTYTALVLNEKGTERYRQHMPPLSERSRLARTMVHLCDVFVRRNTNRSQADEIATWDRTIRQASESDGRIAAIGVNAAWGSNWLGEFTLDQRMDLLIRQHEKWSHAGFEVVEVFLGDPMGWNIPVRVEEQLRAIRSAWPSIRTFHLHLHNTRGMAVLSAYSAMRTLDSNCRLVVDTSLGGMAGCPYCGNGRAATLPPTEDFVQLLEAEGIDTGVDLGKVIEAVALAERVVGHPLYGHVSKAGPLPAKDALYPMDMPLVETLEQAQHFRLGANVYEGGLRPWKFPIQSPARKELGPVD